MCGIAGILKPFDSTQDTEQYLKPMVQAMVHRGPDSQGYQIFQNSNWNIGLGHTRLAILDLSDAGNQPMEVENGQLKLTYNGEIYNYREIRKKLGSKYGGWKSHTDTEVLLRGYQKWGTNFFQRARGMFAFGLWDSKKNQLLLGRDPFGIKPVYYFQDGNIFLFASEVRALLASDLVPRKLSKEGLLSYLQYGSVQTPLTMIEGIRSVLPGHTLIVEPKDYGLEIKEIPYDADLFTSSSATIVNYKEAQIQLRELLKESLHMHLVSDVPLGLFLSGGIDSSALVSLMNEVSEDKPKTFCVTFDEKEFSESRYARLVAEQCGTEHQEILLSEETLLKMLPTALKAMDQPTMEGINTFVVAKAVKEAGITVALSGLGGDELFAGYPSFSRARSMQLISKVPYALRLPISRIGRSLIKGSNSKEKFWSLIGSKAGTQMSYAISRQLFSPHEIEGLVSSKGAPRNHSKNLDSRIRGNDNDERNSPDSIREISILELQGYMANTLLRDTDAMSMAHSLEVRVPFLDPVLVKFVLSLPGEWKMNGSRPKPLLLDAMGDLLPEEIWKRQKMGFCLPFERWMLGHLVTELDRVFMEREYFKNLGLNPLSVETLWQRFRQRPRLVRWSRPWALYVLAKWAELNGVTQ